MIQILDEAIELHRKSLTPKAPSYGKEVEECIRRLEQALADADLPYPRRWTAIKLLEKDEEVWRIVEEKKPDVIPLARDLISELEKVHGHDSSIAIANERASLASQIARRVVRIVKPRKPSLGDRFDELATHPILGYLIAILFFLGVFSLVFGVGGQVAEFFEEDLSEALREIWVNLFGVSALPEIGWSAVEGTLFLLGLTIPYILPLYFLTFTLENWGYLSRISFLMDSLMHRAGVHGKAVIPLLLGFGCNVPGCLAARIMDTWRERLIAMIMATLIPCSAVTVVVMGLVGRYVGVEWVIILYIFALLTSFLTGVAASRILPGEAVELIMEMPSYKVPSFKTILVMTWLRLREYFYIAAPLIILSGVIIKLLELSGALPIISDLLSPITSGWLGLPKEVGILLIFGILRKELILAMLASLTGTLDFSQVLSANQMITLSLVTMLYIPCVATISTLVKEAGMRTATLVTVFEIALAIMVGGAVSRLLLIFGIS